MKIIITNDDGIMAPGIRALAEVLSDLGDVAIVAPETERSATGHGITIWDPIRVKKFEISKVKEAWAISGTPADCVKMAVQEFYKDECGLIISGINNGPNLGTDVLYSGTVSAAIEGIILGVPSIAVSLASFASDMDYTAASKVAYILAKHFYENKENLPPDTLLNVNVPAGNFEDIKGFRVTRLGIREYDNVFERRTDPRGNIYFWLKGEVVPHTYRDPELDVVAVEEKYVSISPVHFDLTNYRIMDIIKKCGFEMIKGQIK